MNAITTPSLSIEKFEAGDIDPARFNHESHVYIAWLYVQSNELADAIGKFDKALKHLVSKFGERDKYHATLTWFFMLLVAERTNDNEPWLAFKNKNQDIVTDSKKILSRYYTAERLYSESARKRFVLPDKLAAP